MSADVERGPCPSCGEPTALAGRVCPHCGGSLLVDLVLSRALPDARQRYQAARALAALAPPFPPFLEAQRLLGTAGSSLAQDLTRTETRARTELLLSWGVEAEAVPSRTPLPATAAATKEAGQSRTALALGVVAVVAVVAAAFVLLNAERSGRDGGRGPGPAGAALPGASAEAVPGVENAAQRALASAVAVRCSTSRGAGFFVADGLVLTNAHVLCREAESPEVVLRDGTVLTGSVEREDRWLDVALLRVRRGSAPPLPLGDATRLREGSRILAVGSPSGLEFSVSQGILSHAERVLLGTTYLQVDAAVSPGSSGGPLTDAEGRAVGIVSMRVTDAEGLALALPINALYEGEDPWLERPASASRERWAAVRRRAREVERSEVEEASNLFRQPGLVAAAVLRDGSVRAVVARRANQPPGAEGFIFEVRSGGGRSCRVEGESAEWTTDPDAELVPRSSFGGRVIEWYRRNRIPTTVYYAAVRLAWNDACPEPADALGAEVFLEQADPKAHRTSLVRHD